MRKYFRFSEKFPQCIKGIPAVEHVSSLLGGELKVILDFCLNFISSYSFFRFIFVIAWYTKLFFSLEEMCSKGM